jgi:hypothetical protein
MSVGRRAVEDRTSCRLWVIRDLAGQGRRLCLSASLIGRSRSSTFSAIHQCSVDIAHQNHCRSATANVAYGSLATEPFSASTDQWPLLLQ